MKNYEQVLDSFKSAGKNGKGNGLMVVLDYANITKEEYKIEYDICAINVNGGVACCGIDYEFVTIFRGYPLFIEGIDNKDMQSCEKSYIKLRDELWEKRNS